MNKEIRCQECNRYLGTAYGTVVMEIKCASCKSVNQVKQVLTDRTADLRFKFKAVEETKEPKDAKRHQDKD